MQSDIKYLFIRKSKEDFLGWVMSMFVSFVMVNWNKKPL